VKARENIHGWIALDKPEGLGSTQALAKVKWLFNAAKAGHGGTLDPLASGLLPIALGEATKTVSWAMEGRKTYRVLIKWGEARTTDDREGEISALSDHRPSHVDIDIMLPRFEGEISQTPPKFSAIKVGGERAYDLARAGEAVDLAPRMVSIEKIELLGLPDADHAELSVTCGKGTYIRSLARDLAEALGTVGHVARLRRTVVGPFGEKDMISLEKLAELRHKAPGDNAMEGVLRPIETVLDGIPALAVKDAEAQRLRQGQKVLLRGANAPIAQDAVLVMWGRKPLGICSIEKGALTPKRLFNL
jgi:tRNA pseudouridine55 synthase